MLLTHRHDDGRVLIAVHQKSLRPVDSPNVPALLLAPVCTARSTVDLPDFVDREL